MNEDLEAIVILRAILQLEPKKLLRLVEKCVNPGKIFEGPREKLIEEFPEFEGELWDKVLEAREKRLAEQMVESYRELGIQLVGISDPWFPENLRSIYDPPVLLYMRGGIEDSDRAAVSIVGSRKPSLYGLETARRLAFELASAGVTVVSGLARGIDSAAHEGALQAGGRTIAVLGCGLDVSYPKGSEKLREKIICQGALLSEYPLGVGPRREYFPIRNRLISGLSLGVVVVEAHERSGSLITARSALEQGREVFAVPGRIDSFISKGTNRLIKEGACLVGSAQDILQELASQLVAFAKFPEEELSAKEDSVGSDSVTESQFSGCESESPEARVLAMLGEAKTADDITLKTELPPHEVQTILTRLELCGTVKKQKDGRFIRITRVTAK